MLIEAGTLNGANTVILFYFQFKCFFLFLFVVMLLHVFHCLSLSFVVSPLLFCAFPCRYLFILESPDTIWLECPPIHFRGKGLAP